MEFTIRLADVDIAVESIHGQVERLCRDYLTEGVPDIRVTVSPEDIAREQAISDHEAETEGIAAVEYPDDHLETLAVYRKIADAMPRRGVFLMHGAVIAVGERAWLFTAPSGTGKTTHIRLWLENIEGSFVLNGDKPLIRVGDKITVYGTPWAGKEGMQKNTSAKLCGVVILERGKENSIRHVSLPEVFPTLVQQTYRPDNKQALEDTLKLLGELGRRIPLYRLSCNMLPEAAYTAYEKLRSDASAADTHSNL